MFSDSLTGPVSSHVVSKYQKKNSADFSYDLAFTIHSNFEFNPHLKEMVCASFYSVPAHEFVLVVNE